MGSLFEGVRRRRYGFRGLAGEAGVGVGVDVGAAVEEGERVEVEGELDVEVEEFRSCETVSEGVTPRYLCSVAARGRDIGRRNWRGSWEAILGVVL